MKVRVRTNISALSSGKYTGEATVEIEEEMDDRFATRSSRLIEMVKERQVEMSNWIDEQCATRTTAKESKPT